MTQIYNDNKYNDYINLNVYKDFYKNMPRHIIVEHSLRWNLKYILYMNIVYFYEINRKIYIVYQLKLQFA